MRFILVFVLALTTAAFAAPAITISKATVQPTNYKVGEAVFTAFTMFNATDRDLAPIYRVTVDRRIVIECDRADIPATRHYQELNGVWNPTPGPHEITLEVDPDNELGFRTQRSIRIPAGAAAPRHPPASAQIRALRLLDDNPTANSTIEFELEMKVRNLSGTIPMRTSLVGPDFTRVRSMQCPLSELGTARFHFDPEVPGNYRVKAELDPENLYNCRQSRELTFRCQ